MVRFLADASLHHAIVAGCARREPAIDFLSAHAANLHGMSDPAVLAIAAAHQRILVTHDVRTMPEHFAAFLAAGGASPGVFLVKQRTPLAQVIDDLVLVWTAIDKTELSAPFLTGRKRRRYTRIDLSPGCGSRRWPRPVARWRVTPNEAVGPDR